MPKAKHSEDDDSPKKEDEGKKKRIGLIAILISIPAALLLVCCCVAPVGVYFFGRPPAFAGRWTKTDAKGNTEFDLRLDGGNDGLYNEYAEGERVETSDFIRWGGMNVRWKAIDDKTIELRRSESGKNLWFGANQGTFTWSVADDELTLTNTADKKTTKLTRVKK